jgi:hypothetical protein
VWEDVIIFKLKKYLIFMIANYGRLTRGILRTSPEYVFLLDGSVNDKTNAVTYSLREDLTGFQGLQLVAPVVLKFIKAMGLGELTEIMFFLQQNQKMMLVLIFV